MENNSDLTQRKVSISGVEIPFQSKTASGFFLARFGIWDRKEILQSVFFFLYTVRLNRSFKLDLVNKNQTFYLFTW